MRSGLGHPRSHLGMLTPRHREEERRIPGCGAGLAGTVRTQGRSLLNIGKRCYILRMYLLHKHKILWYNVWYNTKYGRQP